MNTESSRRDTAAKIDRLREMVVEILNESDDFPAINRNAKRVLAAVELMAINVEETSPD